VNPDSKSSHFKPLGQQGSRIHARRCGFQIGGGLVRKDFARESQCPRLMPKLSALP
jgi:hypothetical protein